MKRRRVVDAIERGDEQFLVLSCGHHILLDRGNPVAQARLGKISQVCQRCPAESPTVREGQVRRGEFFWRGEWRPCR